MPITIMLEGLDGSGKGTVSRMLCDQLRARQHEVEVYHDPGSTPLAEELRRILLYEKDIQCSPFAQTLLFTACRVQLGAYLRDTDTLSRLDYLILDRWWPSTVAYQCAQGVPQELIMLLNDNFESLDVDSRLSFYLDIPPEVSLSRLVDSGADIDADRFESKKEDLHRRRQYYWDLVTGGRLQPVDATCSPEAVTQLILDRLDQYVRAGER